MKRRTFLIGAAASAAIAAGAAVPWLFPTLGRRRDDLAIPVATPRRAAVVWFSQTGHTGRVGRLIARRWQSQGLEVVAGDYRAFDATTMPGFDLVVLGSPVNYFEAPGHFRDWIRDLPPLAGVRAAAYVTFGGEGGNTFNAVAGLLEAAADRGALPVDLAVFGNMSTFAPTWSLGNEGRILKYRHLPDAGTWSAVRAFADRTLQRARTGTGIAVSREWNPRDLVRGAVSIAGTKVLTGGHGADAGTCIGCGTCVRGCPVGAIEAATRAVDGSRCVACLGCVNTCPAGAMRMQFLGKPVEGFGEFLRRHSIVIAEPPELGPSPT